MQKQENNTWEQFTHSGKVEDYLRYCQTKQGPSSSATKDTVASYARNPGGDRPPAVQNRRG